MVIRYKNMLLSSIILLMFLNIALCTPPAAKKRGFFSRGVYDYVGDDAFDKMIRALKDAGWKIIESEKTSGKISALRFGYLAQSTYLAQINIDSYQIFIEVNQVTDDSGAPSWQQNKTTEIYNEIIQHFKRYTRK